MPSVDRRQFLGLGATATAVAIAGCGSATARPAYADWVPHTGEGVLAAAIDFDVARESAAIDPLLPLFLPSADASAPGDLVPDLSALDRIDEPLLRLPLQTGGRVIGVAGLSLGIAGLGYLVDPATPDAGVTRLVRAHDATVGTGDIDVGRAAEALRAGRSDVLGGLTFEVSREADPYTVYEPTQDVEGVVALSESAVVMANTPDGVRRVIDTAEGAADAAVDSSDTFDWLIDAAGAGDMVVGWLGPIDLDGYYWGNVAADPATAVATQRRDVMASVSFDPAAGEVGAALAVQGVADPSRDRLGADLGVTGTPGSLTVDGERLSASRTYAASELEVGFVEPATPTPTPAPGGATPPPAVAEAASADDFAFTYKPDEGVVRVEFVGDVEADRVTVAAVGTESEVSTDQPGVITYLSVYVAPEGDTVVVTATVDGVTGEVAREEVPAG